MHFQSLKLHQALLSYCDNHTKHKSNDSTLWLNQHKSTPIIDINTHTHHTITDSNVIMNKTSSNYSTNQHQTNRNRSQI